MVDNGTAGTVLYWGSRLPALRLPNGRVMFRYAGMWKEGSPLDAQTFKREETSDAGSEPSEP